MSLLGFKRELKKPNFRRRESKLHRYWRSCVVACGIPIVAFLVMTLGPLITRNLTPIPPPAASRTAKTKGRKATKSQKPSVVKPQKPLDAAGQEAQRKELYGRFWQANSGEFLQKVTQEKRSTENGILSMIYLEECVFCTRLVVQLQYYFVSQKGIPFTAKANEEKWGEASFGNVSFGIIDSKDLSRDFVETYQPKHFPDIRLWVTKEDANGTLVPHAIPYDGPPLFRMAPLRVMDWLWSQQTQELEGDSLRQLPVVRNHTELFDALEKSKLNPPGSARILMLLTQKMSDLLDELVQEKTHFDEKKIRKIRQHVKIQERAEEETAECAVKATRASTTASSQESSDQAALSAKEAVQADGSSTSRTAVSEDVRTVAADVVTAEGLTTDALTIIDTALANTGADGTSSGQYEELESRAFSLAYDSCLDYSFSQITLSIEDSSLSSVNRFSFRSRVEAREWLLSGKMERMVLPGFSRLYLESMAEHFETAPVAIVFNRKPADPKIIETMEEVYRTLDFFASSVYLDLDDQFEKHKEMGLGFDKDQKELQVILYSPRKDISKPENHRLFGGDMTSVHEWTNWLMKQVASPDFMKKTKSQTADTAEEAEQPECAASEEAEAS